MSTPPFLRLPDGVTRIDVPTARGPLAALHARLDAPTGAPVLLVPGFTGSKEDFIAILAPIAAAGREVLAIDQRGQWESHDGTVGDLDPSVYDVAALAQDVLEVARWLAGQQVTERAPHLVGHSFGGVVSRAAALADAPALSSVTLLCSGPGPIPAPADEGIRLLAQVLPVMDMESIWVAKRDMEIKAGLRQAEPDIESWLHDRFVANSPVSLIRAADALLAGPDRTDELATVDLPVLVAYGDRDDVWPPALQADTAQRSGARTIVFPGLGHSPAAEDAPTTAEALLDYWASVERATSPA